MLMEIGQGGREVQKEKEAKPTTIDLNQQIGCLKSNIGLS